MKFSYIFKSIIIMGQQLILYMNVIISNLICFLIFFLKLFLKAFTWWPFLGNRAKNPQGLSLLIWLFQFNLLFESRVVGECFIYDALALILLLLY